MSSSGILRRVALVRTGVSEELSASIIRVTRMGELRTLAVISNRRRLRRITKNHETEWIQFQKHYFSENLIAPRIEPGTSGSVAKNFEHYIIEAVMSNSFVRDKAATPF
jgi:hypothetical protein